MDVTAQRYLFTDDTASGSRLLDETDAAIDLSLGLLTPSWDSDLLDMDSRVPGHFAASPSTERDLDCATSPAYTTQYPLSLRSSEQRPHPVEVFHQQAQLATRLPEASVGPLYSHEPSYWPPANVPVATSIPHADANAVNWLEQRRYNAHQDPAMYQQVTQFSYPTIHGLHGYGQQSGTSQLGEVPEIVPPRTFPEASSSFGSLHQSSSMPSLNSLELYPSMGIGNTASLAWKSGFDVGHTVPPTASTDRSHFRKVSIMSQSSADHGRASLRPSRTSSGSTGTRPSYSTPPSPMKSFVSRRGGVRRNSGTAMEQECNADVLNEYSWLPLQSLTTKLKQEIMDIAEEKRLKNPQNDQLPDSETVASILDSFSQSHVITKLNILNHLFGESSSLSSSAYNNFRDSSNLPKMTLRETSTGVDILIQTSNGLDDARPDFINPYLTGLRHCPVLRNQLCRTRADVYASAEKRPHNSWFIYRGAQMNRAAILKMTECITDDLDELRFMEQALFYGIGVVDKEQYAETLRSTLVDPMEVKTDLTAIGYVVSYMWQLEAESVKIALSEFSRIEHDHKLRVFPYYRYAPRRSSKKSAT